MKRLYAIIAAGLTLTGLYGSSEIKAEAAVTFLTPQMMYLEAPWTLLDNVSDSVFWVKRGGGFLSFDEKYEFWKTDGTKLFDAEWEKPMTGEPVFDSGVLAMRRPSEGYKKGNVCLLCEDFRRGCDDSFR